MYNNYDYISVNEVKMWIGNNGDGSHDPRTDGCGFYWPGGDTARLTAIYQDGLCWGGIIDGQIRVNGNTHRQGIKPGVILPNGQPDDPMNSVYKIFKIKRNWQALPPSIERDRYEYDYNNWPTEIGASWVDVDGDGIFTRSIDKPKYYGDETLFYAANDRDEVTTAYTYGSPPIGLEFKTITYGFSDQVELKDAVFKKYKIINKSPHPVENMFLTLWTDDDLGEASDDFIGCDTLLNLGYTYNGDEEDNGFYDPPAAVGHLMVQGPIIEGNSSDSAYYNNNWLQGYKNLPITAFDVIINLSQLYRDPIQAHYEGSIEYYNYMNGLQWNGDPFIDPNTGLETKFCVAGDPVNGIGWYEGDGWPGGPDPGNRRYLMTSGPFTLTPGDTQEVVYSIFMARGTDRLNSVQLLKEKAQLIQNAYYNFYFEPDGNPPNTPENYFLSQNYPNPFNYRTKINYSIPRGTKVEIIIYDILGRELKTLIDKNHTPGNYQIEFNGNNLASGVYIYQIKTNELIISKKMVSLK